MDFEREEQYQPIPSLNYQYEITVGGRIRNTRTGKQITNRYKKGPSVSVRFCVNGKRIWKTLAALLWEVHGIEPKREFPVAKTVYVNKGGERYCFTSYRQCVKFLMNRTPRKKSWLFKRLKEKRAEIYGWQILYREPEQRKLKYCRR